jgi:hypothetical protein
LLVQPARQASVEFVAWRVGVDEVGGIRHVAIADDVDGDIAHLERWHRPGVAGINLRIILVHAIRHY